MIPPWVYELAIAPAALLLACAHAARALGPARAAVELGALVTYGFALEWVAIRLFGAHDYGDAWRVAPLGVPLAVAAVWAAVIVASATVAARLGFTSALARAAAAGLVATSLDLLIEPVAVRSGLWRWTPPGPWLGVPVGNFVGWTIVVTGWVLGLQRAGSTEPLHRTAARRAMLAVAAIGALALVGTAGQARRVERALTAAAGWTVAASLWLLTCALGARRTPPRLDAATVGVRLATPRGPAPEVILLGVAAAFGWNAIALGEGPVRLAALAGGLALGAVALPSRRRARRAST